MDRQGQSNLIVKSQKCRIQCIQSQRMPHPHMLVFATHIAQATRDKALLIKCG